MGAVEDHCAVGRLCSPEPELEWAHLKKKNKNKATRKKQNAKQTKKNPGWSKAWQGGVCAEYAASGAFQVTAEHFWGVRLF